MVETKGIAREILKYIGSTVTVTMVLTSFVMLVAGYGEKTIVEGVKISLIIPLLLTPFPFYKYVMLQRKHDMLTREIDTIRRTDALTKLYNRSYFLENAKKLCEMARRQKFDLSCIMINVDHFTEINEKYNAKVGDTILIKSGQALTELIRTTDVLARYGGGEFALLLPWCSSEDGVKIAQRAEEAIESLYLTVKERAITTTASIGCFTLTNGEGEVQELLSNTYRLMQIAKEDGGDVVRYGLV